MAVEGKSGGPFPLVDRVGGMNEYSSSGGGVTGLGVGRVGLVGIVDEDEVAVAAGRVEG